MVDKAFGSSLDLIWDHVWSNLNFQLCFNLLPLPHHLQEQLRHVRIELRAVNPLDAAVVAALNESEAAIMTRVTEKRVQMAVSRAARFLSLPGLTRVFGSKREGKGRG